MIPLPLDSTANGKIRILDQQAALGYTHVFGADKVLDVGSASQRPRRAKLRCRSARTPSPFPASNCPASIAGGLPQVSITNFTTFGRQSTNPQWQDPSLLDPKVNFTWVKGKHSLKFGYEYEHIWMAVNDNNPLYGSGPAAAATACHARHRPRSPTTTGPISCLALPAATQLANYFVVHLRQSLDSAYVQDDWKVLPNLTLNLGLRWEYGSPFSEENNYISNFDPVNQVVDTISPGAVAGNGIKPVTGSGVYGKTLVNPHLTRLLSAHWFSYRHHSKYVIRGGFGTGYVHYTRAGSGDIAGINAPQAQFAAVTQPTPTTTERLQHPVPAQIIAVGTTTPSCYVTADQGFPTGLVTTFNSATDNITWVPKDRHDSYVENFFLTCNAS